LGAREIIAIAVDAIVPGAAEVRAALDIPEGVSAGARTDAIVSEALEILAREGAPAGIYLEVTSDEFLSVYAGEGRNAPMTPLAKIAPSADRLALFAATAGPRVCERIRELYAEDDFALTVALDAAASLAAERAGDAVRERFMHASLAGGRIAGARAEARGGVAMSASVRPSMAVLAYSPGYCGWDVTGQRALFAALRPEDVGITLNASYLMQPLKSVSGVIAAGSPEIHLIDEDWPFCADCVTRECRERVRRMIASMPGSAGVAGFEGGEA
jgi:hypothetical protein